MDLPRHAHQQIGGRTEVLHDRFVITGSIQLLTHLGDVGRTLVGQLDERTAGEVQPQFMPLWNTLKTASKVRNTVTPNAKLRTPMKLIVRNMAAP